MDGTTDRGGKGRPRKPRRVGAEGGGDAPKGKHTIVLAAETYRRLAVHAAVEGRDKSEVVAALIDAHCRRYVVQDRGKATPDGGANGTVEGVPIGEDLTALFFPDGDPSPGAGEGSDRPGRRRTG